MHAQAARRVARGLTHADHPTSSSSSRPYYRRAACGEQHGSTAERQSDLGLLQTSLQPGPVAQVPSRYLRGSSYEYHL